MLGIIKKMKEQKKELETLVRGYVSSLTAEGEKIDLQKQELQKTYTQITEEQQKLLDAQKALEEQRKHIIQEKSSLEKTLAEIKTTMETAKDLSSSISEIEQKYQSQISTLQKERDSLLQGTCSLEEYAKELSAGKKEYQAQFLKEFGEKLSEFEESLPRTNDFSGVITVKGYHARIRSGDKSIITSWSKGNDGIYISKAESDFALYISFDSSQQRIPFAKEILQSKEMDELAQLTFFKWFTKRGLYDLAKSTAEQMMTEENEKKYVAVLKQSKNMRLQEVFQDFKPAYQQK